jgi:hypothetical protein
MRVGFRGGTIQPSASFSGQVQFRAPRDGSKRFIEYREPGRSPVVIDLSRVGPMTPDSAFEGFAGR